MLWEKKNKEKKKMLKKGESIILMDHTYIRRNAQESM